MSFDKSVLDLVPLVGEVVQLDPALTRSGARFLLKTTAFESALISEFPDEAGPDGKWLKQMGSSAFCAADWGFLRPDEMGRDTGAALEKILFADLFHTLPILFERQAFVIAKELPPWSEDLLEESYVRNVWQETRGSSICLSESSVRKWKKNLGPPIVAGILNLLLPNVLLDTNLKLPAKGGRPEKLSVVVRAYRELGLINEKLPRKQELRMIEQHIDDDVSSTMLDRARRRVRQDRTNE
jgi:hypothetical protein